VADRLMLFFSNPVAGQDDAFNEWYDSHHVADLLAVPGIVAGQRYDLAPMTIPDDHGLQAELPPPTHRYLAVYELDRDPDDVIKNCLDRIADGRMTLSETMDLATISMTTWTARGQRLVTE
jgi:hypothetical protein